MSIPQRKTNPPAGRPAYRTLEGWALGVLMEQHAVTECEHHGHRKDRIGPGCLEPGARGSLAEPVSRAPRRRLVSRLLEDVMRSIGDSCPDC